MSDIDTMLAGQDSQTGYENLQARIDSYINRGDFNEASTFLQECLNAYPASAAVHRAFSQFLYNTGDIASAIGGLGRAIQLDPSFYGAYAQRAYIYEKEELYREAASDYGKVIKLRPGKASGYYARGQMYLNLGNMREAALDFKKCLELEPNGPLAAPSRKVLGILQKAEADNSSGVSIKSSSDFNISGGTLVKYTGSGNAGVFVTLCVLYPTRSAA